MFQQMRVIESFVFIEAASVEFERESRKKFMIKCFIFVHELDRFGFST